MAGTRQPDWVAPALLVGAAIVLALVVGGIYYAVTAEEEPPPTVAGQLEAYTGCLEDHGANVPVIETRSDGGIVVIVPGALIEGDIDLERFVAAREACRHLEPNPLELLFAGEGFDLARLLEGFDRRGPRNAPFGQLRERCERLAHGDIDDPNAAERLRELCHDLGG